MRRFLIWSALAVVIGLGLAGAGYWAYWNFYARFQPVTVTRNQAEIQRLLDEASWVSEGGGGQPLYIVGYRDSATSQRYEREETEKLRAGGVEVRVIVFARADREGQTLSSAAERATVAELWLNRDWVLYQRWTATPAASWTAAGIPPSDGNLARSAVVEASRTFVTKINDLLRDAGVPTGYPLVIWRDRDGFMKACACTDARSWPFIRDDFDAPDRVAPGEPSDPGMAVPSDAPPQAPGAPDSLPYPTLPGIPPANGQPGQPGAAPQTPTPTPRTTSTPPGQTATPQPTQQDESTFY
ncbi:hypothetical protein BZG35_00145 [Brevundimonas sp. LM2]|uniref:hypothetical protein n=1 Tax=Brevundimonas sp. LM2 TaxID=1938605 RepID=UPI00098395E5|nr:hypothetical protein [Brevundimonas sp. LM2]AQR60242.1 hypothetical protein BZG35_00145 [Brevundimonas sp. LM2]